MSDRRSIEQHREFLADDLTFATILEKLNHDALNFIREKDSIVFAL